MAGIVALASCSSAEIAVDYDEETKSGFMVACADSVGDSQLVSSICDCVYVEIEDTLSYREMADLQTPIVETTEDEEPADPLADEFKEIVADCVADQSAFNS